MSAYVVDPEHIAALVGAAMDRRLTWIAPEPPREGETTHQPGLPWGPDAQTAYLRRRREATDETATETARLLFLANVRSVAYRYDEPMTGDLPGSGARLAETTWTAGVCRRAAQDLAPVAILKAIDGYEYQCCERPDWRDSEAYAFCTALRGAAIKDLPGYEAARWEICPQPIG